jgi:hypothetical protein
VYFSFFLWYWRFNSGPHTCKVGILPLELLHQPFCIDYFEIWSPYIPWTCLYCDPPVCVSQLSWTLLCLAVDWDRVFPNFLLELALSFYLLISSLVARTTSLSHCVFVYSGFKNLFWVSIYYMLGTRDNRVIKITHFFHSPGLQSSYNIDLTKLIIKLFN